MVIDMNEAQVRTLEQVRQALDGTQALEFRRAEDALGTAQRSYAPPVEAGTYPWRIHWIVPVVVTDNGVLPAAVGVPTSVRTLLLEFMV